MELQSILQPGRELHPGEVIEELDGHLEVDEEPVARGGYSAVYRGRWTGPKGVQMDVAVKEIMIHYNDLGKPGIEELQDARIRRELFIWKQTTHRHLQPFLGYSSQPRPRLICPWCRHGNLSKYLTDNPELSTLDKLQLIYQTGRALEHLHSQSPPICHADIKPENVLVNDLREAVLSDFGLSRTLQEGMDGFMTTGSVKGSPNYMAPELHDGQPNPYSLAGDIYAFGGLILRVMSGNVPFYKIKRPIIVCTKIVMGNLPKPQDHSSSSLSESDPLWELMRRCWSKDAQARPSASEVLIELSVHMDSKQRNATLNPNSLSAARSMDDVERIGLGGNYPFLLESLLQPGRHFRPEEIIDELEGDLEVPEKPVACGGFANIYQGFWTDKYGVRTEVAIKEIRRLVPNTNQNDAEAEELQRKRIGRELFIWSQTKHPNLQPLLGYQSQPRPRLICPWARHGNLTNYLQNNPGLTRLEKLYLIYQTGLGLCHLHSQNPTICHGDIKPENVLINDACTAALCDFGLSCVLQDGESGFTTSATAKGPMAYMAPELFLDEKTSLSSDVYAFGGLVLKVMTGKAPFYSSTNQDFVFAQVVKGQMPNPQAYPELPITDPLWKLKRRCWAQVPDDRPTMRDVLAEISMYIQFCGSPLSGARPMLAGPNVSNTSDRVWEHRDTVPPPHDIHQTLNLNRRHPIHALLVGTALGLLQFWLEAIPVLQHIWPFMRLWLIRDAAATENEVHPETSSTAHLAHTSISASTLTAGGTTSVASTPTIGDTADMAAVVEKILEGLKLKSRVVGPIAGYMEALTNGGRDLIKIARTSDGDPESLRGVVLGTWRLAGLVEDLQDKLKEQGQDLSQVMSGIVSELKGLQDAVEVQRWFCQEDNSQRLALQVSEEIKFLMQLGADRLVDEAVSTKIQDERRQLLSTLGGGKHGVRGTTIEEALCLPGTRVDVLNQVDHWIRSSDTNDRALWIRGMAGRGKSTIATTIVERWKYRASCAIFHFRRGQSSSDTFVACSLAKQLGNSMVTDVRNAITESVRSHPDIADERLDEQFKTLIVAPLRGQGSDSLPVLMVVDGLDECENPQYVIEFLRLIDQHSPFIPTHVKFLFTSRPETDITRAVETKPWRVVNLDSLGAIHNDMLLFIQRGCDRIRVKHGLPEQWPSSGEVAQLVEMSQGLFVWARTALSYIEKRASEARLRDLLTRRLAWNGLAAIYHQILEQAFADLDSESQERLRQILAILVVAPDPISLDIIASLLEDNAMFRELDHESSIRLLEDETLADMNSLILIPRSATEPVHLLHDSVRDLFLDRQRCEGRVYQIDITLEHERMAVVCLRFMLNHLQTHICDITTLSTSNSQIQELVDIGVSHTLRYCCRAWAVHLTEGIGNLESTVDDGNATWRDFVAFTEGKIPSWFEVMNLIGAVPEAISLSGRVHQWLSTSSIESKGIDQMVSLWYDASRFEADKFTGIPFLD